jgi:hypothetical protein
LKEISFIPYLKNLLIPIWITQYKITLAIKIYKNVYN